MDLREKPGKVQKILEILMRIRLLSLVGLVVATIAVLASSWQNIVSLPVGASGALVEWLPDFSVANAWNSAQYLVVATIATVVLSFVFGKVRAGVSAVASIALFVGSLVLMDGNETMPLIFFGVLALVSIVCILFVKMGVACGLFPFVLGWLFLSALVAVLQPSLEPSYLVWAALSALGFAGTMGLSALAGKYLGEGMPKGGAMVKAAKQMVVPMLVSSLLVVTAIAFDMPNVQVVEGAAQPAKNANIWGAVLFFFVFNLWFFVIQFPVMTFAPWERLRSGSRRVEMKDKKKKTAKKSSKK
ncbi:MULTISPECIES: hypothetical protein [unclassified Fibrobacter]|uniref:hypothetical protein n=1 Tax=unclassified Fibrobacter TaxID=2634177 RepID=UPI000D6AF097|nr:MULTISPECIES: hypothetical protein [unclassified Fibrobacter]PWJ62083.1 hypothetical protein BGX12_12314 [Fibrobacter sp. UWR4]PZW67480.1 hypothetical protein C8E88_102317 [Fibrobacter sp. UWR1]